MKLNEREAELVFHILEELLRTPLAELNKRFGSITINEMMTLHSKLYFREFCEENGITYEEMTDEDIERAYREGWEA